MTDDLKERLLTWHPGQDEEALREEALARITDLEARLAAAEADVNRLREGEARLSLLLNETALARDAAEAENIRLKRQVETLKTGWGIADRDRIKAEAGEDALAEAIRDFRDCRGIGSMRAALAAYEVRRKG